MSAPDASPRVVGRYQLFGEIAAGGMASVHLGRLIGAIGFARTVAIKRLLPHFGKEPEFIAMFMDEARIAARIRHPNVVSTLDVVTEGDELFLVMDYVEGEALSKLLRASANLGELPPRAVVLSVMHGALSGLHAAHEAKSEQGEPLEVVHRDVSPQNILVGVDGTARVLDFGIAKAVGRLANTQTGQVKGKFAYMAPEQLGGEISRRTDIYGASVVLWEALTGKRLFTGDEGVLVARVLEGNVPPPSVVVPSIPPELDRIVMRGLAKNPADRYATALDMARDLGALGLASALEVGEWVSDLAGATLSERAALVSAVESSAPRAIALPDPATVAATVHRAAPTEHDDAPTRIAWPGASGKRPALASPLIALLLAAILGTLLFMAFRNNPARPAIEAASATAAPARLAAPPAPSAVPAPAAPSAAPSASASAAPAHVHPARLAPAPRARPASHPEPACNPPYFIDSHGIKTYKPGCL